MAEAGQGCYVYCVVAAGDRPVADGVEGVDQGADVEVLGDDRLNAVVSVVSLEEFGAEALRRNLEDMAWLERTARAHQAVLDRVLERVPALVPMRLCTIFEDADHVREMLAGERDVLVQALERVRDHSEWSVKALADPEAVAGAARERSAGATTPPDAGGAGRAYLARKGTERTLQERGRELVAAAAEEVHARLTDEADAATLLPPQRRELSGRRGEMVLNGAYLVHHSRAEAFRAVVDDLRQEQREPRLELELTGPWAPYNFVAAEQPA
jgi:hypothetical protein